VGVRKFNEVVGIGLDCDCGGFRGEGDGVKVELSIKGSNWLVKLTVTSACEGFCLLEGVIVDGVGGEG